VVEAGSSTVFGYPPDGSKNMKIHISKKIKEVCWVLLATEDLLMKP
jgi:hypothetical protein